jgi:hypothetical protein
MEGANEAARRAANSIIDVSGAKVKKCKIWDLHEPPVFFLLRRRDYARYKKGLPWSPQLPLILRILFKIRFWIFQKSGH